MDRRITNSTGRILASILGGFAAVIVTAIGLGLISFLLLGNFFVFSFASWTSIIFIPLFFLVWLFVAMMSGGYISARIAKQNEYHITWTILGMAFILWIMFKSDELSFSNFPKLIILLTVGILGALAGCDSGIIYKEKRRNREN